MASQNLELIKAAYQPSPETEIKEWEGVEWVFYDHKPIVMLGQKKALPAEYVHPEPGYNIGRCSMIKTDGKRCPNAVKDGWRVCRYHGAGGLANLSGGIPRHQKYLPTHLSDRFQEFIADPDALALYSEMALVDSRVTELTEKLESCDNKEAWDKVNQAMMLLYKITGLHENVDKAYALLRVAKQMPADEQTIWKEISVLLETRRRLAQTEQNRIITAKQYLSLAEANAMLASVMEIVMTNITDPNLKALIATKLRETIRE